MKPAMFASITSTAGGTMHAIVAYTGTYDG
jgi:hypothetical protein